MSDLVAQSALLRARDAEWSRAASTGDIDLDGTNTVTDPVPGGAILTLHGRAVTVWRIDPDGPWRCAMDIWNEGPSPA